MEFDFGQPGDWGSPETRLTPVAVHIWDETGKLLSSPEPELNGTEALCFSPDGERLAGASDSGRVRKRRELFQPAAGSWSA